MGDPLALRWGPKIDLGLYGSSFVGWLAALVQPTSDPCIPQFDLKNLRQHTHIPKHFPKH